MAQKTPQLEEQKERLRKERAISEFLNSQDDGSSFDPSRLNSWTDDEVNNQYKSISRR